MYCKMNWYNYKETVKYRLVMKLVTLFSGKKYHKWKVNIKSPQEVQHSDECSKHTRPQK